MDGRPDGFPIPDIRNSVENRIVFRRITGFHLDEEQHWVAELECGHGQHVRHDPPWQLRPWVTSEGTRRAYLGTSLDCRLCDETAP